MKITDAVLTITGTAIVEAMVLDRPAIMFGDNFYDHSKLIYKIENISDLPNILKEILLYKNLLPKEEREIELNRFLLSYIQSLISTFPLEGQMMPWADALIEEMERENK